MSPYPLSLPRSYLGSFVVFLLCVFGLIVETVCSPEKESVFTGKGEQVFPRAIKTGALTQDSHSLQCDYSDVTSAHLSYPFFFVIPIIPNPVLILCITGVICVLRRVFSLRRSRCGE